MSTRGRGGGGHHAHAHARRYAPVLVPAVPLVGTLGRAHGGHAGIQRHSAGLIINMSGYERRPSRQDAICSQLA